MASEAPTTRPTTSAWLPSGSPSIGEGRAVVAVVVVFVLVVYQLPLVPLLAYVLHRPGYSHASCTSSFCYCKAGYRCPHHNDGHREQSHVVQGHGTRSHAETPSFSMCGAPGAAMPFVIPVFDKALLSGSAVPEPRPLPPLTFAGSDQHVRSHPIPDIFHPPRLA